MPLYQRQPVGTHAVDDRGTEWIIEEDAPDDDGSPAYFVRRADGKTVKGLGRRRAMLLSCFIERVLP